MDIDENEELVKKWIMALEELSEQLSAMIDEGINLKDQVDDIYFFLIDRIKTAKK